MCPFFGEQLHKGTNIEESIYSFNLNPQISQDE